MQKRVTSRYSIIIPLRRGRALLYNSLNAGLSLLDANEYAAYRQRVRRAFVPFVW